MKFKQVLHLSKVSNMQQYRSGIDHLNSKSAKKCVYALSEYSKQKKQPHTGLSQWED